MEQKWNDFLENYFNSWPEWKKKSGFCYHTSAYDSTTTVTQMAIGEKGLDGGEMKTYHEMNQNRNITEGEREKYMAALMAQ